MSRREGDTLKPLARLDGDPVFDEPWQAEVLAMADRLAASGVFTRELWSETLGDELVRAERDGKPDDVTTYYEATLKTLERLLEDGGHVTPDARFERREAWEHAYRTTPHGKPVLLERG
ncbi:MAG: nitrile hydratase accessory protein [Pseudomonadota bacterium]